MPRLEIRLLGTPQFYLDGAPLDGFVTRKAQALLIYLIGVKHPLTRDALAAIFWPDVSEQHFLTLTEPQGRVSSVAFSADGAHLAAGGYDHDLYLWDVSHLDAIRLARTIHVDAGFITYLAFSPVDSIFVVVSTTVREVALWDATSGVNVATLAGGHSGAPDAVAFSPCGQKLASGGVDQGIAIWDVASERLLRRMEGHRGAVRSLFWLDEEILCSSAADATIRIWHAPSGELLSSLEARGPYAGMKIRGATGLSMAQRDALIALGAGGKLQGAGFAATSTHLLVPRSLHAICVPSESC